MTSVGVISARRTKFPLIWVYNVPPVHLSPTTSFPPAFVIAPNPLSTLLDQSNYTRSCAKVQKQGIILGRSADHSKLNSYDELLADLDRVFDFNDELLSSKKNWLVVYTDNEGDMMLVRDDPWQDFCCTVRKKFIYTKEEVQKMSLRMLNSKSDDDHQAADGSTAPPQ